MRRAERGGNDLAMLDDPKLTEMREYYDRGRELGRLGESYGQLEFERTREIILRNLP